MVEIGNSEILSAQVRQIYLWALSHKYEEVQEIMC